MRTAVIREPSTAPPRFAFPLDSFQPKAYHINQAARIIIISSLRLTRKALYAILHAAMTENITHLPLLHGLFPHGICHRNMRARPFSKRRHQHEP